MKIRILTRTHIHTHTHTCTHTHAHTHAYIHRSANDTGNVERENRKKGEIETHDQIKEQSIMLNKHAYTEMKGEF